MIKLRSGSATDVGRVRSTNQDQLLVDADLSLFAVADGMGGHQAGEVASQTAVGALRGQFRANPSGEGLVEAMEQANRAVWQRAQEGPELRGMGTTLTAVALVREEGEERLAVANVGDSRAYLLKQGALEQLTEDHGLVEELVRSGQITEEEAAVHPQRHVLTRALGVEEQVDVDLWEVLPYRGDRLLLCSDGLPREVSDPAIASVLRQLDDPAEAARELVDQANAAGGSDNVSVVVIDVVDDDDRAVVASAALAGTGASDLAGSGGLGRADGRGGADGPSGAGGPGGGARTSGSGGRGGGGSSAATSRTPSRAQRDADLARMASLDEDTTTTPPAPSDASTGADAGVSREWGRPQLYEPPRRVTVRVVAFVVVLLLLLAGAVAAVGYYARRSYFVGLEGDQLVIYQGRPEGLLWFDPEVVERTDVTSADVLASRLDDLQEGKQEPSLASSRRYVANLKEEAARVAASTTTTTTAVPPPGGPPGPGSPAPAQPGTPVG